MLLQYKTLSKMLSEADTRLVDVLDFESRMALVLATMEEGGIGIDILKLQTFVSVKAPLNGV